MTLRSWDIYEEWLRGLSLDNVRGLFREHGAKLLLCKVLPKNANSKNQVYIAQDLSELGRIPTGNVTPVHSRSEKGGGEHGPIFQVAVALSWITPEATLAPAPEAKFIAYPQYPEVRFSGFLQGSRSAPSFLFAKEQRGAEPGRLLFLGIRDDQRVLALAVPPEALSAREFHAAGPFDGYGVFAVLPLTAAQAGNGEALLLGELARIHRLGWIASQRLNGAGHLVACNSSNCGGYTLEAQLGIRSNGSAEPDFHGWEVKARNVTRLEKPGVSRVTLFTPEPDGGAYSTDGAPAFIRRWGYADTAGRGDRLNFGGIYRCGAPLNARTKTRLIIDGYEASTGEFRVDGAIRLLDSNDVEAASWSFVKLMDHWKRKHAKAAFVPCAARSGPERSYSYAGTVLLGEGAEFRLLLQALAAGQVYYDPGIKLEEVSGLKPKPKTRSQFRVSSRDLSALYQRMRDVAILNS